MTEKRKETNLPVKRIKTIDHAFYKGIMDLFQNQEEVLAGSADAYSGLLRFDPSVWRYHWPHTFYILLILTYDGEKSTK